MIEVAQGIIEAHGTGAEAWVESNIQALLSHLAGAYSLEALQEAIAYQVELLATIRALTLCPA